MKEVRIRPIERGDVHAVCALLVVIDRYDGGTRRSEGSAESIEAALFDDPAGRCGGFVAVTGGKGSKPEALVGVALFHFFRAPHVARETLYLDDIFVTQAQRDQGVGRRLMRALATLAVGRECAQLDWTTAASNVDGLRFYRRLGALVFDQTRYCRLAPSALIQLASEPE